ncbi:MAG: hypothetical protein DRQ65_05710 [Gammaproteobacteria bacterium]|nr:MAG: hypothetical protein DRQ98_08290 [Gammaproteobacteria bacterium]RLA53915.1 MAG: hypothetical protein DRQ65_05710 [Gammaproteobacteria bacterium]
MARPVRQESWLAVALQPAILKRGVKVGLVVGTTLALINHGDKIFTMTLDGESLLKIGLTYLVPFGVSTWASVQTARTTEQTG